MTARFFLDNSREFLEKKTVSKDLNADVFHHLRDVLRVKTDDVVELVADRKAYLASIQIVTENNIVFSQLKAIVKDPELPIKMTIVVSPLKSDHLEWLLQKATELGVFKIILTDFAYSVVRASKIEKKLPRYQKILKAAAEQSHRLLVPEIIYEKNFLKRVVLTSKQAGIVAWEESAKQGETSKLASMIKAIKINPAIKELISVFGPEGGISQSEIKELASAAFVPVGLGPRILRAETAPLYLLSSASLLIELS